MQNAMRPSLSLFGAIVLFLLTLPRAVQANDVIPRASKIEGQYLLYAYTDLAPDTLSDLDANASIALPDFERLRDGHPGSIDDPQLRARLLKPGDPGYQTPPAEMFGNSTYGLSAKEFESLDGTKPIIALAFSYPAREATRMLRTVRIFVESAARQHNAAILDLSTYELFSPAEWMWFAVTSWQNGKMTGILLSVRRGVSALEKGSVVTVSEFEAFDYLIRFPDGSEEGNETGPLIEKQRK